MDDDSQLVEGGIVPDPLLPNIVPELIRCLNKAKEIREGVSFLPLDCYAIVAPKFKNCSFCIEDTPVDRQTWMWPFVAGYFSGQFVFVHKKFSTKKIIQSYFNIFFAVSNVLNNILKKIPTRIKMDLEKEKYHQYTDWFSFLFIVFQYHPKRFQDWLDLRGLPRLSEEGEPWILEKEYFGGSQRWRLTCDPLAAIEATVAGLLLVIENYFQDSVELPDLSAKIISLEQGNLNPNQSSKKQSQGAVNLGTLNIEKKIWEPQVGIALPVIPALVPVLQALIEGKPFYQIPDRGAYSLRATDGPKNLCRKFRELIRKAVALGFPFPDEKKPGLKEGKITFRGGERGSA